MRRASQGSICRDGLPTQDEKQEEEEKEKPEGRTESRLRGGRRGSFAKTARFDERRIDPP